MNRALTVMLMAALAGGCGANGQGRGNDAGGAAGSGAAGGAGAGGGAGASGDAAACFTQAQSGCYTSDCATRVGEETCSMGIPTCPSPYATWFFCFGGDNCHARQVCVDGDGGLFFQMCFTGAAICPDGTTLVGSTPDGAADSGADGSTDAAD